MTMLKELAAELIGMFFAEKWLTVAVLGLIAVTRSLLDFTGLDQLAGGAILLFGSLLLLLASVCYAAKPRTH
jgi:uncharacterized membrane protein